MEHEPISFRTATTDDMQFMEKMCYLAVYSINGKIPADTPPLETVRNHPWFSVYVEEWGRKGDYGLIAVDENGKDVGAAWYRNYSNKELPENLLSIALEADHQGQGVGRTLLRNLMLHAAQDGRAEISLTVEPENTNARRLYERLGFTAVGIWDGLDIMTAPTHVITDKGAH